MGDSQPFLFTFTKGEQEVFEIHVSANSNRVYEWTADLLTIVNGRRFDVPISANGQAFLTAGTDGLEERFWSGEAFT